MLALIKLFGLISKYKCMCQLFRIGDTLVILFLKALLIVGCLYLFGSMYSMSGCHASYYSVQFRVALVVAPLPTLATLAKTILHN